MELNETEQMAQEFINMTRKKFGDRVDNFCILDVTDDRNHRAFSVEFTAYNYFWIRMNYELGSFGCGILNEKVMIGLENSQEWWDKANFNKFFRELKRNLELRIPDKYLKAKGWKGWHSWF